MTKKTITFLDPKLEEKVSEDQRENELFNSESVNDEEKKEELN